MEQRWGLLLLVLLVSGCIEAGNLELPTEADSIDFSIFSSQLKELQKQPSTGDMGVPLKTLPDQFIRSGEFGTYMEAFSLDGLPSTTIVWKAHRDPYAKEYRNIQNDMTDLEKFNISSTNIDVTITDEENLYRIATHIGLYTFVSETENPEDIDSVEVYGTHEEVVKKVFFTGVENALSYDLVSLKK